MTMRTESGIRRTIAVVACTSVVSVGLFSVVRPAEDIAISICRNTATGAHRIITSGECAVGTESAVAEIAAPTTTATAATTPIVQAALKKYVVDKNGKTVGELISNEGLSSFWVMFEGGQFQLSSYLEQGETQANGNLYSEPDIFADKQCQSPYLSAEFTIDQSSARSVLKAHPTGAPSDKTTRRAYRPVGSPFKTPSHVYIYQLPGSVKYDQERAANGDIVEPAWRIQAGCIRIPTSEIKAISSFYMETVFKSVPAKMPSYSPPLRIEEH